MTPAISALEAAGIAYGVHEYERGNDLRDFGREAADALGLPHEQVFKTLVLDGDGGLAVAVVPVDATLSLKAAAKALGVKKVAMSDVSHAERSTGYVVGGISPFGQRRRLPTVVDRSAIDHPCIYVSGGRRGLDVSVEPDVFVRLLDARFVPLVA